MTTILRTPALACGLLAALTLPSSNPTLQPPQGTVQEPLQEPARAFVLEAGKHQITDLIDRSAQFLGRNYIYDQNELASAAHKAVTLQRRMELDATGCEEVVGQLAYTLGVARLTLDERRGLYEWVSMIGPNRARLFTDAAHMSPDEVLHARYLRVPVMVAVPLRHINVNQAINQLRPFFAVGAGGGSPLTLGAAAASVLLMGMSNEVAAAVQMLREVDVAPAETASQQHEWRQELDKRLQAIESAVRH